MFSPTVVQVPPKSSKTPLATSVSLALHHSRISALGLIPSTFLVNHTRAHAPEIARAYRRGQRHRGFHRHTPIGFLQHFPFKRHPATPLRRDQPQACSGAYRWASCPGDIQTVASRSVPRNALVPCISPLSLLTFVRPRETKAHTTTRHLQNYDRGHAHGNLKIRHTACIDRLVRYFQF